MANRHKAQSSGGHKSQAAGKDAADSYAYAGGGSKVAKAAKNRSDKYKFGGKIMGKKSKARMDKFARGGRAGTTPFSSAKIKENTDARGHGKT